MIPNCVTHQKPMRMGTKGNYFCATLITTTPQGKKIWCDYRVEDIVTPPSTPQNRSEDTKTVSSAQTIIEIAKETAKADFKKEHPEPNWDAIAEGKVRNSVAVAFISQVGAIEVTPDMLPVMESWVEWIMTGKLKKTLEDLSDEELAEIQRKIDDEK